MGTVRTYPLRPRLAAAIALVLALLATLAVPAQAELGRYLVPKGTSLPTGAQVLHAFDVVDMVLITSPTLPMGAVSADEPLTWQSIGVDEAGLSAGLDSGVASTRAPDVWSQTTGERAVVALIDTGIAPIPSLQGAVAGEIDFSGTGGGDGYGHGTFMASLIAARGDVAPGVAPGAGVLSLKVAGPDGSTTLGRVLYALDWLHGPGRGAGIPIAMMALGVDSDSIAGTMLDAASDRLASTGMLVVTASGNEGLGKVTAPSTATKTFSVGAVDDQATADRSDDKLADFSASGPDRAGAAQPDIVASGVAIVGHMAPDSHIAREFPDAIQPGENLFRGSGTSMPTALAAGVAALAFSARPDLDGAGLEAALRAGGGELDAVGALAAANAVPQPNPPGNPGNGNGNGKGKGKGNGKGVGNGNDDQIDPNGVRWRGVRWRGQEWLGEEWDGVRWRGVRWRGVIWDGVRWRHIEWDGVRWRNVEWDGVRWRGVRWRDVDWAGVRWRGVRWREISWDGVRWRGVRWTGEGWGAADWDGVEWGGVRWRGTFWAADISDEVYADVNWGGVRWTMILSG
ncbi:MAG TPA: S8 family serine peptidase [Egibacteraceae bacterium]|nr:S8 family serine peptidase [Egibacteraceae bacterium]